VSWDITATHLQIVTPIALPTTDMISSTNAQMSKMMGKDLLDGAGAYPDNLTVTAVLVDPAGNVQVYGQLNNCAMAQISFEVRRSNSRAVLERARAVRDDVLAHTWIGQAMLRHLGSLGPHFVDRLRAQPDAGQLMSDFMRAVDSLTVLPRDELLDTLARPVASLEALVSESLWPADKPLMTDMLCETMVRFCRDEDIGRKSAVHLATRATQRLDRLRSELRAIRAGKAVDGSIRR
jgi:hypothetical protein